MSDGREPRKEAMTFCEREKGMNRRSPEARLEEGLAALQRRPGAPAALKEAGFADALMSLMGMVLLRNEQINLTSITEPLEFTELHLLDSLAVVGLPEMEAAQTVIDIGSGAGFPGLPLALLYPEKRFWLIDALRKRVEAIADFAEALGVQNVSVRHLRAESAGRDPAIRGSFDLAVCRALAPLPVALEYCLPTVRTGGALFAYKTVQAEGEIADAELGLRVLGASPEVEVFAYRDVLPERGHAIYVIRKERETPGMYPRKEGTPSRVPL